ncbi:MAG: ribokinase [Phycisphaerae bacterium]
MAKRIAKPVSKRAARPAGVARGGVVERAGKGEHWGGGEAKKLEALPTDAPGRASVAGPKSGVGVVGSLNMDLVVRTETMPRPGETVLGQDLLQTRGGTGANQAAAAGRLWNRKTSGAKLIGRIGEDVFGENMLVALNKCKVDVTSVLKTRGSPSGTAMILVDRHGENAIVVASGANRQLSATDLLAERKTIETSVVLTAQLEVPHDTVACAFALARRSNVLTILDPAPAPAEGLPESLYHVDILTPNQMEAQILTGMPVRNLEEARRAAERFLIRGTRIVVMKMGSQGAAIVQKDERGVETVVQHVTGYRIQPVDTTAAGDAFTGALAVGLAEGMPLAAAVKFANAAGALACLKQGAMGAIPGRAEVEGFMAERA